jgi:Clp amino terminal domain, pathogenicity island component
VAHTLCSPLPVPSAAYPAPPPMSTHFHPRSPNPPKNRQRVAKSSKTQTATVSRCGCHRIQGCPANALAEARGRSSSIANKPRKSMASVAPGATTSAGYNAFATTFDMYERFRQDARRAIFFADREARQAGSAYIEPEHLFLSLTRDADSKANQLFALADHIESFRKQLEGHVLERSSTSVDCPLSNASKRVLAFAAKEADQLGSVPIGTEHLLLGLLRENKSTVPVLLATAGINLHSARNRVRQGAGLPLLENRPESTPQSELTANKKATSPFTAPLLFLAFFLVLYLIIRLVNS